MPSNLNHVAQLYGDYMQVFDNFRALMTDFSKVTGLSVDDMQDDALLFSSADGSELSFFHSQESGFVSVMVTAGLLPEADRPAIAEVLMRDNPALWIRGEACFLTGAPLEHLTGALLASMTQGLVELAASLNESLKSGTLKPERDERTEPSQGDLHEGLRL